MRKNDISNNIDKDNGNTYVGNNIGKAFIWIAWILVLGVLVFIFQETLERQWNPNKDPDIFLSNTGRAEVHLQQNRQGHYIVQGKINDQEVTFLLDTGATQVSIPAHIAQQLDLHVKKGRNNRHRVNTANGAITVYQTTLDQLSIGNIFLYNVAAHINPAMKSDEILLGMSALKRVEFSQTGKQLILREQQQ
jgi:aspartyl protease family protein